MPELLNGPSAVPAGAPRYDLQVGQGVSPLNGKPFVALLVTLPGFGQLVFQMTGEAADALAKNLATIAGPTRAGLVLGDQQ